MRNLIYGINLSIDGCCDHTKFSGSDDILEYFGDLNRNIDTFIFGRKTYDLMVPFWPGIAKNKAGATQAMNYFAESFAAVQNIVVFSRTLEKAQGKNARVVKGSITDEILKLKQEEGKSISIDGTQILSQIIDLGLIDEYHFVIHPVVVGEGKRLLQGISLPDKLQLKLAEAKILSSGCVALRYLKP